LKFSSKIRGPDADFWVKGFKVQKFRSSRLTKPGTMNPAIEPRNSEPANRLAVNLTY
jgi:hypothetical protein